jgi:tripartite ATP-independent transporter DctP family solute receptor
MNRTLSIISAVAFAVVGLVRGAEAEVTLKFGHQNNPGHSIHESAVRFAELVGNKTNGEVKIEVFPSAQLGRLNDLWTGVKLGSVEIAGSLVPAVGADLVPALTIFDAPYVFNDIAHFERFAQSPKAKEMGKKLIEKGGVRILWYQTFGFRNLTANKPITNPQDLAGMKIRSVTLPGYLATVEGLGATPTPIEFSEVYQSLRTGVVDGQENPVSTVNSAKLYEVQTHLMLTRHILGIVAVMINEKVFQSLSPQAQKAMLEAASQAAEYGNSLARKEEKELVGKLQKLGMKVIGLQQGLDVEAFRKRVRAHVYPKFEAKWGDVMGEVQSLAK